MHIMIEIWPPLPVVQRTKMYVRMLAALIRYASNGELTN